MVVFLKITYKNNGTPLEDVMSRNGLNLCYFSPDRLFC